MIVDQDIELFPGDGALLDADTEGLLQGARQLQVGQHGRAVARAGHRRSGIIGPPRHRRSAGVAPPPRARARACVSVVAAPGLAPSR